MHSRMQQEHIEARMTNIEYNLEIAKLEIEQSNNMMNWMGNLAKSLFTALIMINGGAIISLLTFLGNSKFITQIVDLWFAAIGSFCLGIVITIISMFCAFFAQKIFREGLNRDIKQDRETDVNVKNRKGITYRNWAIVFVCIAILCFVSGVICALFALKYGI